MQLVTVTPTEVLARVVSALAGGGSVELTGASDELQIRLVEDVLDLLADREAVVVERGSGLQAAATGGGAVHVDASSELYGADMAAAAAFLSREPSDLVIIRGDERFTLSAVIDGVDDGVPLLYLGAEPLGPSRLPAGTLSLTIST